MRAFENDELSSAGSYMLGRVLNPIGIGSYSGLPVNKLLSGPIKLYSKEKL